MASFEEKLDQKEDKNIIELSFEGSGGEFQFHRLNKNEAFRLKEEIGDDHPGEHLQGSDIFETTITPTCPPATSPTPAHSRRLTSIFPITP